MIIEAIEKLKESRVKQWPVNSNRASSMGHECLRYLVLERTSWQEKTLHDAYLQAIFDDGNVHESAVLRDMQDAGIEVIEQQRAFSWPEFNITGHIDCKIIENNIAVPTEIKSASPFSWQGINDVNDLYNGRYHYLRKYPAQLTLYLLMDNKEYGYFVFKNKATAQLKEIRMGLDYELGESLLQKAEAINKHAANNTLPDHCEYSEDICGNCGYLHICLPDIKRSALEITSDPELEQKLVRFHELKPYTTEYNKLNKELKSTFQNREKVIVGDYLITGKLVERKGYAVQDSTYWSTKFERIKK